MKRKNIIIYITIVIIFIAGVTIIVLSLTSNNSNNQDGKQSTTSSISTNQNNNSSETSIKKENFTTKVNQTLIDEGIEYVKNYYILPAKKDYSIIDIAKTKEKYNCEYTKPAMDGQYLYLNLTCIGSNRNANGEEIDFSLTNFSQNATRLKYTYQDGKYIISEMVQPISPSEYPLSFPQEYIQFLNK